MGNLSLKRKRIAAQLGKKLGRRFIATPGEKVSDPLGLTVLVDILITNAAGMVAVVKVRRSTRIGTQREQAYAAIGAPWFYCTTDAEVADVARQILEIAAAAA